MPKWRHLFFVYPLVCFVPWATLHPCFHYLCVLLYSLIPLGEEI